MQFFNDTNIDFVNKRKIAFVISAIVILAGIISLIINGGPKYGIDFTGGVALEVDLKLAGDNIQLDDLRKALDAEGISAEIQPIGVPGKETYLIKTQGNYKKNTELAKVIKEAFPENTVGNYIVSDNGRTLVVNLTGEKQITPSQIKKALQENGYKNVSVEKDDLNKSHFAISTESSSQEGNRILKVIKKLYPKLQNRDDIIIKQDVVGPRIGEELKGKAWLAILWSLIGIVIYIWFRFELTYGMAAVVALFHDVLITIGLFSIFGKEITLTIIAALLTIVGYSLNDTIVVFDRIRENRGNQRKSSFEDIINKSINDTISRTIITSLTTFVVVLSLFLFGGKVIHDFAFALLVGVIVGTYSSIFIASPILIEYYKKK